MDIQQLGITKEELLNLAAQNLADQIADIGELESRLAAEIEKRITTAIGNGLNAKIDAFLNAELSRLVDQEFTPVDMWGDKTGNPTTIRNALSDRAMKFWEMRVDERGKESSYGGTPRHEQVYGKIVKEKFDEAIKANAEIIVSKFKEAIKSDAVKLTSEHIDRLIKTGK